MGGSLDVYVQKRKNTKRGKTRGQAVPLASLELCRKARGLLDRTVARPLIARGKSFRRWSRPKRNLRAAKPKNTTLGCGGDSGGDSLHSHLRASLPPPLQDHWGRPEP